MTFIELGIARLIVPLLILRFPLPGIIAAELLDNYDWQLLPLHEESDYTFYQYWDKALDSYYLSLAFVASRRWDDAIARKIAAWTFGGRMLGVSLFFVTGDRIHLFVFPNIFEGVFVFVEVFSFFTGGARLFTSGPRTAWIMTAVAIPRWTREYFVHVAQEWPWYTLPMLGTTWDSRLWKAAYWALPLATMVVLVVRARTKHREPIDRVGVRRRGHSRLVRLR